jgi:hypothetical protein
MNAPRVSSMERAVLTPIIAQRMIPQKEEAMFCVASSRLCAAVCVDNNVRSATPG